MACHGIAVATVEDVVRANRDLPAPPLRRAIRVGAGVSQERMAGELRVTRATVSRWENGERHPRDEHLVAYVRLLRGIQRAATD
jgi:DNA-binding transcriptional regulator YiaG